MRLKSSSPVSQSWSLFTICILTDIYLFIQPMFVVPGVFAGTEDSAVTKTDMVPVLKSLREGEGGGYHR